MPSFSPDGPEITPGAPAEAPAMDQVLVVTASSLGRVEPVSLLEDSPRAMSPLVFDHRSLLEKLYEQRFVETGRHIMAEVAEVMAMTGSERRSALLQKIALEQGEPLATLAFLKAGIPYFDWRNIGFDQAKSLYNSLSRANWDPAREEERLALVGGLAEVMVETADRHAWDVTDDILEVGDIQRDNEGTPSELPSVGHPLLEACPKATKLKLEGDHAAANQLLREEVVETAKHSVFAGLVCAHAINQCFSGDFTPMPVMLACEGVSNYLGAVGVDPDDSLLGRMADCLADGAFGRRREGRPHGFPGIFPGILSYQPQGASFSQRMDWASKEQDRLDFVRRIYAIAGVNGLVNDRVTSIIHPSYIRMNDYATRGALVAIDASLTSFEERQRSFDASVGRHGMDLPYDHPYPQALWVLYRAASRGEHPDAAEVFQKHIATSVTLGLTWDAAEVARSDRD